MDDVQIEAPLIQMNKKEIVKTGEKISSPMNISYSCYMGETQHCGICESCMRRKRAFEFAGVPDETQYAK